MLFVGNQYNRNQFSPIGLFRKVPKERGHLRTVQKLGPFVRHFDGPNGINTQLKEMLDVRGFKAGSDVVVMVINEGEIDLFLNFVCSCHLHNITTSNVLVFAGSKEIIMMIESTGAMGIYHEGEFDSRLSHIRYIPFDSRFPIYAYLTRAHLNI